LGGGEEKKDHGKVSEEECKRIFKNLTYLSAKKRSFLEGKAKQSKAKEEEGSNPFYMPWNPESSIGN
jgi:hypothetical protein